MYYIRILVFIHPVRSQWSLWFIAWPLPVKFESVTRSPNMATFSATYFSSLKSMRIGTTSVFRVGVEGCAGTSPHTQHATS